MNFVNQDGIPWWTFQLGVLRIWIISLQIDLTCLGMCSVFYINKNGSYGGHFTSGITTQTCSPKNSHLGLLETPKGGVILGTFG